MDATILLVTIFEEQLRIASMLLRKNIENIMKSYDSLYAGIGKPTVS